ncbi:MAG: hypothetical protein JWN13_7066 [Betaproteobacteria bacterium]|jgi:hypothetical protein|nr:hypothetical protein [Betaproteobacteria bacterium]
MIIVDAINSAPTEHAVYFLVTAYIESLCHFNSSAGVPRPVLRLPISGPADLASRLDTLESNVTVPLEAVVPVSEVAGVLSSAVNRIGSLTGVKAATGAC